jgi:hypothetical protein
MRQAVLREEPAQRSLRGRTERRPANPAAQLLARSVFEFS